MRHLTREYKGGYSIENKNASFDCDVVHVYRLADNSRWAICYDRSMTKHVYASFKEARQAALNITEKR